MLHAEIFKSESPLDKDYVEILNYCHIAYFSSVDRSREVNKRLRVIMMVSISSLLWLLKQMIAPYHDLIKLMTVY